jgi:hypothetical protein
VDRALPPPPVFYSHKLPPVFSQAHVDRAIAFAAALRQHPSLHLGKRSSSLAGPFAPRSGSQLPLSSVKVTPFYDDIWPERGRCQGARPCPEPIDQHYAHRATAMLCPAVGGWPAQLKAARAWIPEGRPAASLLYIYDGQTTDVLRETFGTCVRPGKENGAGGRGMCVIRRGVGPVALAGKGNTGRG